MITVLVLTQACCVLEHSKSKSLLWTQNAVSSLTSVQAHSKQISVCQEILTSFRSRKPSGLYRANFTRLYVSREKFSLVRENLIVTTRCLKEKFGKGAPNLLRVVQIRGGSKSVVTPAFQEKNQG